MSPSVLAGEIRGVHGEYGVRTAESMFAELRDLFLSAASPQKAAELLRAAADARYQEVELLYAQALLRGRGAERNVVAAKEIFRRAHERGDMRGSAGLASALLLDRKTESEALSIAKRAAEAGYAEG